MSEDTLIIAYRLAYWRHNEDQVIQCDFDTPWIRKEINKLDRFMRKIENRLGYYPGV